MEREIGRLSGEGNIYSYTIVFDAPEGFENLVPYVIAMVQLSEGMMVTARLTDVDVKYDTESDHILVTSPEGKLLEIGSRVEMVTRKISEDGPRGLIRYGYSFRPKLVW